MRIRKRPLTATSSGNPELHESSNGGLHLRSFSKSNPNFQDPRSSLLCPVSIVKQDHLLLARPGYGSQKNLPAEGVSLMRKPYIAESVMDVRHQYKVKHMHIDDGDVNVKSMDMKGCNELGLLVPSGGGDELAEIYKKARHDIACKGSALHLENANAGPAMVDVSDDLGKVRPLQLILSSDDSPTAPKLPLPLCPTSSSSTLQSSTPPPPSGNFDKALPCLPTKTAPFQSWPVAGSLIKQNIAVVKSQDEMRLTGNEDASRRSQNNSDETVTNLVGNRAELESCSLLKIGSDCWPVSSWQGHRRPRSHVQGGRGPSGVNAVFKTENTEQKSLKKPKQTKRKSIDVLVGVQAPIVTATGHGQLEMQDCRAAQLVKNKGHTKKTLLPTSTACVFPTSTKMIGFIAAAQSLETKRAATTHETHKYDDHVASVAATAPCARTSDNELELDSMRCRRKDGRRWRCKEQVLKAGSPFCHYHTLKMREKHAASVARKLLKQLQGEVKISSDGLSCSEFIRSSKKSRKNRSAPSSIAVQDGYGGGCKGEEDEEEEENEYNNDGQQKMHAKLGQEQLLRESLTHRRRWRKKCKPCIRRLHDIHDRASRPAGTEGLDFLNPEERYDEESLLVRSAGSSLPECLLNTDPYEWRSDFP